MTNEELVAQIQAGVDVQGNMAQLYQQNRNFIVKIALPFSKTVELEDLVQEAFFGLEKAARKYNPDEGTLFLTYAEHWIRQSIQRYCTNNGHTKRIPAHVTERISKYQKFRSDYVAVTGDEPIDEEYCFFLNINRDQLKALRKYMGEACPVGLDDLVPGTDDLTVGDTLADEFNLEDSVIDRIAAEQENSAIWAAVNDLGGKCPAVIEGQYKRCETLEQTAMRLEISKERVRQLKSKSFSLLRRDKRIKEAAELYGYGCGQAYHWGFKRFDQSHTSSTEFLALKHIEQEEGRLKMLNEAREMSATTTMVSERMRNQNSGYTPRGIQRLAQINAKIDQLLQAERDRRNQQKEGENLC